MKYRQLGRTGLRVSEIGFGCGGNAGLMVRGSREEQRRVVGRALELGINYFDNAPDYGNGLAETNLGRVLEELGARPVVTSKVEVRAADLGDIAGHVVRSTEETLRRLRVERLDVIQIHNGPSRKRPEQPESAYTQLGIEDFLRPGGALDGLQRLLRDGKARCAGFVCRGNDAAECRRLIDTGLFHVINVPYTLLNPSAGAATPAGLEVDRDYGGILQYARDHDVGAAVYSPLAGGFLTDDAIAGAGRHPLARPPDSASDGYRRDLARARALRFLSREGGHTLAQAATRFVLMHPGVSVVLGGFSDTSQLEEIVAASPAGPLDAELVARIEGAWRTNFEP